MSTSSRRERSPASRVGPERSSGERSETERSGGPTREAAPNQAPWQGPAPPDPEVLEKAQRRQFSAAYKLRILGEVDACTQIGEIGQILRREGLYSSHLNNWRRQRDEGALSGLQPKKRGRRIRDANPLARELAASEAENRKLKKRLAQAQTIIEFQKKVADVLGIPLNHCESEEHD